MTIDFINQYPLPFWTGRLPEFKQISPGEAAIMVIIAWNLIQTPEVFMPKTVTDGILSISRLLGFSCLFPCPDTERKLNETITADTKFCLLQHYFGPREGFEELLLSKEK